MYCGNHWRGQGVCTYMNFKWFMNKYFLIFTCFSLNVYWEKYIISNMRFMDMIAYNTAKSLKKGETSLVAQWLRIRLPMQGTRVWALVWEDPTCRKATKPLRHDYWACALEPASHNYWSPRAESPCSTAREATAMRSPCTAKKSSPCSQQRRPNAAKNK